MKTRLRTVTKELSYHHQLLNALPDYKILDWSKLKEIADDILKCIQNGK